MLFVDHEFAQLRSDVLFCINNDSKLHKLRQNTAFGNPLKAAFERQKLTFSPCDGELSMSRYLKDRLETLNGAQIDNLGCIDKKIAGG